VNISQRRVCALQGFGLARRTRISLLVMTVVSGSALISVGAAASASAKTPLSSLVPAKIRATGNLTDLVNSPYTPMEYQATPGGPIVGFDIDVARAIAKELALKLVVTNTPSFAELTPARDYLGHLASGTADAGSDWTRYRTRSGS